MSQLPKGWVGCKLKDAVDKIVGGGTPSKSVPSYFEGDIPWMTVKDMNKLFLTDTIDHITDEAVKNSSTNVIPAGTPIIATRMSLGKIVRASFDSAINQDLKALFVNKHIDQYYFEHWYRSQSIKIESLGTGTTVKGIRLEVLNELDFPLSPLAEQTRIVEKLDEVLAQVDTIKARLDGIPAILKRFRQSVLAAAVSGKLTEEWRGNHPALDSTHEVANIIESRKAIVAKRMQVPQEHLKNEEYPIPDSWTWTSLDALSSKIVDGVHHKPEYVDEGIPFMSVKDINGGKLSFDNCKYISQVTHEEIHPRCNPCRGDLLITKSGTIGRTAIIKTDDIFDLFVSVALIKPASSLVNMEFINIALMHWVNSIDVSSRVVGTAIKNLHLRDMRVLAVPFAPLEEQKEIVRLVDQYFAFADTIEAQVKKAQARVDKLTQSILAKAFRGELVPQDPNDEPADKLLERIAAARKEAEVLAKVAKKAAQK
ncbi:Type I restriction enzyme EcoKI, S subunit [Vibrio cholerae]|nr:Type I restriction enzyme EcoKI, S subunit [Vibrio cholerae]